MLYLLNSIPQQRSDWQLIDDMLEAEASVLFYEKAVDLISQEILHEDATPFLFAWLDRGVKIFVLADQSSKELPMSKPLVKKTTVVDWKGFVDLTANNEKVFAL